jgi:hypothetical protein
MADPLPALPHRHDPRQRALGWGVRCDPVAPGVDLGRDLAMTVREGRRDLALVGGVANLAQDLAVALTTLLGSDPFNTRFGFDGLNALAEETDPVLMRERVRIAVIRVLRDDPRVARILDVKLIDHRLSARNPGPAGAADAGDLAEPIAVDPRTLWVRVGFETVAGDRLSLDLGKDGRHG